MAVTKLINAAAVDGVLGGYKNKICNGNFDVWQRGTSFTATGYSSDRWHATVSGTVTHSREESDVPSGSVYAHKWTTGASNSYGQIREFIESSTVKKLRGKIVTASALIKCSANFSGDAIFEIGYSTTTDTISNFNTTFMSVSTTGKVVSTGYVKITTTFTVPSNAVGLFIGIVPTVAQGSGVSLLHAQVQLEEGSYATDFEQRHIQQEIALCQRYAINIRCGGNFNGTPFLRTSTSMNMYYATIELPVALRTTPSIIFTLVNPAHAIHKPDVRWDTASTIYTTLYNFNQIYIELVPTYNDPASYGLFLYGYTIFVDAEL